MGGICGGILFITGIIWCGLFKVPLPWSVDVATIAAAYMILGYKTKSVILFRMKKSKMMMLTMFMLKLNIVFAFINYRSSGTYSDVYSNQYGNPIFYLISSVSGIAFVVGFSILLNNKLVLYLGRNSVFFCGIHIMIIEALIYVINRIPEIETNGKIQLIVSIVELFIVITLTNLLIPVFKCALKRGEKHGVN